MSECGWVQPGDHGGLPAPTCHRDAGHSGMHHADPDIDSGVPASMHGGRGARAIHISPEQRSSALRDSHRNSKVRFIIPSGHKAFHLSLNDTWYCIDCTRAEDWEDVIWSDAHPNEKPKR